MGPIAKTVCLVFGAIYVLGVLLFLLAPALRKRLKPKWPNQDSHQLKSSK